MTRPAFTLLAVLSGAMVNCRADHSGASLPEVHQPKASPCEGPCPGEIPAALCTYPELLPDQPMLAGACLQSALPKGDGKVEIRVDLRSSGSVVDVHLPTHLSRAASACLREWASRLAFSAARDCEGKAVPTTATLTYGLIHGRVVS